MGFGTFLIIIGTFVLFVFRHTCNRAINIYNNKASLELMKLDLKTREETVANWEDFKDRIAVLNAKYQELGIPVDNSYNAVTK